MSRFRARHRRRAVRLAVAIGLVLPAALGAVAGEDVYAYVEDGEIVLTDKPRRGHSAAARVEAPARDSKAPAAARTIPASHRVVRGSGRWDALILREAERNSLDAELVKAVVWAESNFDAAAVSPKGAIGLMQLMPETARRYGVKDARTLRDPEHNVAVGARHLRELMNRYEGNVTLALAAYNAGTGAVQKYRGVPAYRETQNYVRKIRRRLGEDGLRRASGARPIRAVPTSDGSLRFVN